MFARGVTCHFAYEVFIPTALYLALLISRMSRDRQLLLACSLLVALLSSRCARVASTPLDDYVNKPDPTYRYEDLGNPWKGDGYTSYFINLTSQTWLSGMQT